MSILHSFCRRVAAALAFCSALAAVAPAQAAVIAVFDPLFGPAFSNLGFRGQATFDVTAGCYSLGSGIISVGGTCQITPLSAEVDFYSATDPLMTTLNSVILNSFPTGYVFGAYVDPLTGQITGFGTNDSNIFSVVIPSLGINTSMVLFFQLPPPPPVILVAGPQAVAAPQPGVGGAYLRNCTSTTQGICGSNAANTSLPASLTVSVVPEPDSVALALLGFGALFVARRRRSVAR